MTNLEKIQAVASKTEIYLIELDFRENIDFYNNQNMENYKSLHSMFEPMIRDIMVKIESDTHRYY